jgi:hypothetical protein
VPDQGWISPLWHYLRVTLAGQGRRIRAPGRARKVACPTTAFRGKIAGTLLRKGAGHED